MLKDFFIVTDLSVVILHRKGKVLSRELILNHQLTS